MSTIQIDGYGRERDGFHLHRVYQVHNFHCKGFKECNAPNPTHTEASQVCNGDAKAAACLKCQEGRRWIKPWRFAVHCNLALSRLICNLLCNTVGIVPYLGSLEKKPLEAIAITTDRITMYTKHTSLYTKPCKCRPPLSTLIGSERGCQLRIPQPQPLGGSQSSPEILVCNKLLTSSPPFLLHLLLLLLQLLLLLLHLLCLLLQLLLLLRPHLLWCPPRSGRNFALGLNLWVEQIAILLNFLTSGGCNA